MDNKSKFEDQVFFLDFNATAPLPVFKEVTSKKWILFGEKDDYPAYLLDLYKKSERHRAIIQNKVKYIVGKGIKPTEENDQAKAWLKQINDSYETADDVLKKCTYDGEIFGGYYLEIIWNKGKKISSIKHIDFNKFRSNKDNTLFYYKSSWDKKYNSKTPEEIAAFDPSKPKGKQIFFYKEYEAGIDTYTLPSYVACTTIIEADIEVSQQILSNAKGGFSASKLINLYNGETTEEGKKIVEKKFEEKFTGARGKKFVFTFNKPADKAPDVGDLGTSDLTKENFTNVDSLIENKIFTGHQVTSKMLFGVAQAGSLGGNDQIKQSFEIFKNTYANDKQQSIERVFNMLAEINGIGSEFKIQHIDPIGIIIDAAAAVGAMDRNEVREHIGLEADAPEEKVRNKTIRALKQLPTLVANKVLDSMTDDEIRALGSLPALADGSGTTLRMRKEAVKKPVMMNKQHTEKEAAAMFELIGEKRKDYTIAKSNELNFTADQPYDFEGNEKLYFAEIELLDVNILSLIDKDHLITPQVISDTLKVSIDVIEDKIKQLIDDGYIKAKITKTGSDKTTERELTQPLSDISDIKPDVSKVFVLYSYEVRPDAGDEIIDGTRPFCKKLIELDKLYSRTDIENISMELGYSVWDRRGGFWMQPDGTVSPSCRHIWKSNVLIKK